MDSTLGPAQANTRQDSGEIKAAQEALSRVLQEATAIASDRRTDMARSALRVAGPSIDATLHSAEIKDDRFQSVIPSRAGHRSSAGRYPYSPNSAGCGPQPTRYRVPRSSPNNRAHLPFRRLRRMHRKPHPLHRRLRTPSRPAPHPRSLRLTSSCLRRWRAISPPCSNASRSWPPGRRSWHAISLGCRRPRRTSVTKSQCRRNRPLPRRPSPCP